MAAFSPFSTPSDSEIDQIISEANDHSVLEQLAAINCSSFSDSLLPSHLETRFRKLKTFSSSSSSKTFFDSGYQSKKEGKMGSSLPGPSEVSKFEGSLGGEEGKMGNLPSGQSKVSKFEGNSSDEEGKMGNLPSGHSKFSKFEGNLSDGEGKMGNSPYGQSKVLSFEVNSSDGKGKMGNLPSGQSKVSKFEENLSDGEGKMGNLPSRQTKVSSFERGLGDRKGKKGKSLGGYVSSPSDYSSSECMDSPKLKGKIGNYSDSEEEIAKKSGSGCLCFSPKRVSRKKSSGGGGGGSGRSKGSEVGFGWGKDEELLSDLRSFSSKEQKKRMKEAIKEEEKINKEAEKIIKWAKQVSARMDYDISDDDDVDFRPR